MTETQIFHNFLHLPTYLLVNIYFPCLILYQLMLLGTARLVILIRTWLCLPFSISQLPSHFLVVLKNSSNLYFLTQDLAHCQVKFREKRKKFSRYSGLPTSQSNFSHRRGSTSKAFDIIPFLIIKRNSYMETLKPDYYCNYKIIFETSTNQRMFA